MKPAIDLGEAKTPHLISANPLMANYDDHKPTDEMVCMQATIPHHIDSHGSRLEDIAGTGEDDSLGG